MISVLASALAAAHAHAATIAVDPAGTNGVGCGVVVAPPCRTIAYAIGTRAQNGDTVAIDASGTPYAEGNLVTTKNISITGTAGSTILAGDGNGAHTTLNLTATKPVTISGLTFRSSSAQSAPELQTSGPVTVATVRFDSAKLTSAQHGQAELLGSAAGVPTLSNADFSGKSAAGAVAFVVQGTDTQLATVHDVTQDGSYLGQVSAAIDQAQATRLDVTLVPGAGGPELDGEATLSDSRIHGDGANNPVGAYTSPLNFVTGYAFTDHLQTFRDDVFTGLGLAIDEYGSGVSGETVTTEGNRISAPNGFLVGFDSPVTHVSTHDTIYSANPISVHYNGVARVNESYLGGPVYLQTTGASCTSTGSVVSAPAGPGTCGAIALSQDPGFVDAANGDFHLKPNSPLIDAGIPSDPSTVLPDGKLRTLDGNADGIARSDAGWDEYAPVPETFIDTGPGATMTGQPIAFTFHSTTAQTSFRCVLDRGTPAPCDSGNFTSAALSAGNHTFSVAASIAGNTDPTPATITFTLSPPTGPTPSPVLSYVMLSPSRFAVARSATATSAAARRKLGRQRPHAGSTIQYQLNTLASLTLTITHTTRTTCKHGTKKVRCTVVIRDGVLTRKRRAQGAGIIPFTGRIGTRALAKGTYSLRVIATDPLGRRSNTAKASFELV